MGLFNRFKKQRFNQELGNDLFNLTAKEVRNMEPVNILLAGKTGSGKSTLINALFREKLAETGVGQPVTQHVQKISKEGVPVNLFDTRGLELSPKAQHEVLKILSQWVDKTGKTAEGRIDLCYYCINSNMARIEPFEIELIQAISQHVPVIIVLTQSLGNQVDDFKNYIKSLSLNIEEIIPVLAQPYLIQGEKYIQTHGLQALVDVSLKALPQVTKKAFINAQRIDLKRKVDESRRWAKRYIRTAFGIGFSPIPVSDSAVLVPMQIGMLAHITAIFGLSLDKAQVVSLIAGLGGTGGATFLGKNIVSSATKLIPGIGTIASGTISGATAGALTVALAYSYIEVLKQILIAEASGRDMPLKELQKLMNGNFEAQLTQIKKALPESLSENIDGQWFRQLFNRK